MIMMFGDQAGLTESRSVEWIKEMIQFMHRLNDDLTKAGELASAEGLADASQARTVRFQHGSPVPTDGPYAESKEALAGFWIVDVENEARALEIASRVVAYIECPVEVRQVADRPPDY
jgi:hypothetical protein